MSLIRSTDYHINKKRQMSSEQNTQQPVDHAKISMRILAERHAVLLEDQHLPADELDGKYNPHGDGEHPCYGGALWRDAFRTSTPS